MTETPDAPSTEGPEGDEAPETVAANELLELMEHMRRYRATTLQVFELVDDESMGWRPGPDQYSLGQQLLHIAQAEDRFVHGLFHDDWSMDRVRFPEELPPAAGIEAFMKEVRAALWRELEALEVEVEVEVEALEVEALGRPVEVPEAPPLALRSWLWFILEHGLHHRGQIWTYLRAMGETPPFYAAPLPLGERPDVRAREELGGF